MSQRRTSTIRAFPIRPLWTSTTSQPTLNLGLAVIPAWPLLFLLAGTFVYFKTTSRRRKDSFLAVARQYLPDIFLAFRILTFCQVAYHRETVLEQGNNIIIIFEFLALVLDHSFVQQADIWASILIAAGWFLLLDIIPKSLPYTTNRLYAVGFLAVMGCVGFPRERRSVGPLISSMSLMVAAMSYSGAHDGPGLLVYDLPRVLDAILITLATILVWQHLWLRFSRTMQKYALNLHHCIFSFLVYSETIMAGLLVSSYMWSCLAWRDTQDNAFASPSVTYLSISVACCSYVPIWIAIMHIRQHFDVWLREREYSFAARARDWLGMVTEAVGWTTVSYCGLWSLLYLMALTAWYRQRH